MSSTAPRPRIVGRDEGFVTVRRVGKRCRDPLAGASRIEPVRVFVDAHHHEAARVVHRHLHGTVARNLHRMASKRST